MGKNLKKQTSRHKKVFHLWVKIHTAGVNFSAQHFITSTCNIQINEKYMDELLCMVDFKSRGCMDQSFSAHEPQRRCHWLRLSRIFLNT
jgi:hypothetical protein